MRVSQWRTPPPAAHPPSTRESFLPSEGGASPPPEPPPEQAPVRNKLRLPFVWDPWRLANILRQGWRWTGGAALVGLILGLALGYYKTETRYFATAQVIRREIPSSFRVNETGEPYKPRTLSVQTLLSTATSYNVLERVATKANPPISVGELRGCMEVKDQRNTDFFFLNINSTQGRQATVDLVNLWAQELVDFSRELQSSEAREIRQFLQKQVDTNDGEIARLTQQILDYSRRTGIFNVDKQVDSFLRASGDLNLKFESSRIEYETLDLKIQSSLEELRQQGPAQEKLRNAQVELNDALTRYTEENPLVMELREKLNQLEKELLTSTPVANPNLQNYTGTFLGNTLYLEILTLQNRKKSLRHEMSQYETLRNGLNKQLESIPEKSAGFASLEANRQALQVAQNLLTSRLKESQLFEQNSIGYFRIFNTANLSSVTVRSKSSKMLTLALGGAFLGLALVGVAQLVRELLKQRVHTAFEATQIFHTSPLAEWRGASPGQDEAAAQTLWRRWISQSLPNAQSRIFWAQGDSPLEYRFWQSLGAEAQRLLPRVLLIETSALCHPYLKQLPLWSTESSDRLSHLHIPLQGCSLPEVELWLQNWEELRRQELAIWLRISGSIQEPGITLLRTSWPSLFILGLANQPRSYWVEQDRAREEAGLAEMQYVVLTA